MIPCEQYKKISDNIGIRELSKNSEPAEIVNKVSLVNSMFLSDEIGPEWYFSLLHDIETKCW
jgi:hypothetical protein